jgi:chromosome partitioning protein
MTQKHTHIVAVCNHKGGVGKTTTAITIGAALARSKKRVLLVDLDAQADLTGSLRIEDTTHNVYELLKGTTQPQPIHHADGFDVIPAVLDLATAEMEFSSAMGREHLLAEALEPMQGQYDYIIIDTPPSLGLLTINAFTAAECTIIPIQAEFLALRGLAKLQEVLGSVQKRLNPALYIVGVVVTMYDGRLTLHKQVLEVLQRQFGTAVFDTPVRINVALAEAPAAGQTIYKYAPRSTGAADYTAIAKELQKRLKTRK